ISLTTLTSGDIAVNGAVSTGSGEIDATSVGAITENVATGSFGTTGLLKTISATGTTLGGANGVGSFNATNTSGDVTLVNTAATLVVTGIAETGGNISVSNTGNLTTSGLVKDNTPGNAISLQATSGTLTIGATGPVTGTTTDTISLTTLTSGDIAVNGAVSTGSGAITVTSVGAISENIATGSFSTTGLLTTSSATGTTLNG